MSGRARPVAVAWRLAALASAADGRRPRADTVPSFWGLGREGEVVARPRSGVRADASGHPGQVQQIPWTAAHEKLLTGFVGGSTPDLAQLGNTWIPEFAAIGALEPLGARLAASTGVSAEAYFEGIWKTNQYGGAQLRDSLVRRHARALLSARHPRRRRLPRSAAHLERLAGRDGEDPRGLGRTHYAILLPTNEWEQLTIFGVQKGSSLLADDDDPRRASPARPSARPFEWYVDLFRDGLAPVVSYTQLGNPLPGVHPRLLRDVDHGALEPRGVPPALEARGAEALDDGAAARARRPADKVAWPGPSLAGGSSLAIFKASAEKDAAWAFAEYLSTPAVQSRFYALSGDLPARREAWDDASLAGDVKAQAFRVQLTRVEPMPRVPEWEQIAQKVAEDMEPRDPGTPRGARGPGDARRGRRSHARETTLDPGPRFRAARHEVEKR